MYVKFIRDTFHPERKSIYPDYCEGQTYDLEEKDAMHFIDQGDAVILENPPEDTSGKSDPTDTPYP